MEQNKQFELEKARLEQQIAEYQEKLERLQAEFDKAKEQRKELDTTYKFLKEHPELNDLKIKDFVDRYEKID